MEETLGKAKEETLTANANVTIKTDTVALRAVAPTPNSRSSTGSEGR